MRGVVLSLAQSVFFCQQLFISEIFIEKCSIGDKLGLALVRFKD